MESLNNQKSLVHVAIVGLYYVLYSFHQFLQLLSFQVPLLLSLNTVRVAVLVPRLAALKHIRKMSAIEFKSSNKKGECPGFIQGNVSETTKGLIVLQEWWGMNDQIKKEAAQIGELGKFVTLVPDLYRGKVAEDSETAGHLMNHLDWPGAVDDIRGAANYLLSIGCTKVGVTGFCMGGALSLAAAAMVKEISASAPFYGIPSAELCDVSEISIPVQAHFGEDDALKGFSAKEDAEKLKEKQKNNDKFELYLYEKCGHAFTNPTGPLGNYNKEACTLALGRMADFMNKWLA